MYIRPQTMFCVHIVPNLTGWQSLNLHPLAYLSHSFRDESGIRNLFPNVEPYPSPVGGHRRLVLPHKCKVRLAGSGT